jgi:hypothetical protein
MEQTRQQMKDMLAAHTYGAQMEPLWTLFQAEMEDDIKARQNKLDTDNAMLDADREKGRHT